MNKQKEKFAFDLVLERSNSTKHSDKHLNFALCFRKRTTDGGIEDQLSSFVLFLLYFSLSSQQMPLAYK